MIVGSFQGLVICAFLVDLCLVGTRSHFVRLGRKGFRSFLLSLCLVGSIFILNLFHLSFLVFKISKCFSVLYPDYFAKIFLLINNH